MRVLVDECAPFALKIALAQRGHECSTVQEIGWSGKKNGELLTLAEADFDVFVTLDRKIPYQQNLSQRKIGLVVINARSNLIIDIAPYFDPCARAINEVKPGEVISLGSSAIDDE